MIKENYIVNQVNKYLRENGYSYKNEVPFLERKIDVVAVKKRKVVAIEAKVRDWKKALSQAISCKLCSHYVYVAFWHKHIPKDLSPFENYGIGVMSVNASVEIIKIARKSEIIHESLLKNVLKQIGDQDD